MKSWHPYDLADFDPPAPAIVAAPTSIGATPNVFSTEHVGSRVAPERDCRGAGVLTFSGRPLRGSRLENLLPSVFVTQVMAAPLSAAFATTEFASPL